MRLPRLPRLGRRLRKAMILWVFDLTLCLHETAYFV
jgi:hypothetical protein